MALIIGLGNPGRKYIHTRHNLGFRAVDEFQEKNNFPEFEPSKKLEAEISEGETGGKRFILAKPRTFMNNSGRAVKKIIKNRKPQTENLVVVHDDIDLPLGKIRLSKDRGSAGHRGVQSIMNELGTKDFVRIRIGVQPKTGKPENLDEFVLEKFTKEEEKAARQAVKKTGRVIEVVLNQGIEKAMSEFNK